MAEKITVHFRVVGIYFNISNVEITVPPSGLVTIKDVMDQIAAANPEFSYTATTVNFSAGPGLSPVSMKYILPPPGASNGRRAPGPYTLSEVRLGTFATVWQYYIFNPKNTYTSNDGDPLISTPFTSFDKQTVVHGDTIIWRLLSILFGPDIDGTNPDQGGKGRFTARMASL